MDINRIKELRQRAKELVSSLTLDEKLSMLTSGHAAVERLNIPEYHIGTEVARGYVGRGTDRISTVFPQPVGLASTFDREIMHSLGEIAGNEARAYYNSHKKGGLALWGPTVDMARDPRWGRNEEAYGEDVCLAGELSCAYTVGMAGYDGKFFKTIPSLKHFCANNNEVGRRNTDAFLPLRLKYDYYYASFENSIVNGGARSLMTAYNEINGCPAVLNPDLNTVVKDKWGLWYTVTDGGDYTQTVHAHKFCDSHSESLEWLIKAGSDSITDNASCAKQAGYDAISEGRLTEEDINKTLENTIFSRFALGLFDETDFDKIGLDVIDCEDHKNKNLKATLKQITLLKNDGTLPISKSLKKIAVVGALADENLMDWYTGVSSGDISVLEGVKSEFENSEVIHDSLWDHVAIKASNGKYLSVGEDGVLYASADTVGEDELFELQDWGENWINFFSVKHKRYIRLSDDSSFKLHNRKVYEWFTRETLNFKKYGDKFAIEEQLHHRRLFCDASGKISVKPVSNVTDDQLFEIVTVSSGKQRAEEIAKSSDFVLYCIGNHPVQVAKECYDRKTLELNIQTDMACHIKSFNENMAMAIISSYPYSINKENKEIPAIIYTSHAGMFLGTAVAKTLSGENNPAGRTPQTWYRSEFDLPEITDYDIETSGTTYMYFKGEPLYPFGHGLSYSSFEYKNVELRPEEDGLYAYVKVKNVSESDGEEVIQIYFTLPDSEINRPIKKLCGFERVFFKAGEEKTVKVKIIRRMLEVFNYRNRENILESGDYLFMIGASSADIRLEESYHLDGEGFGVRPDEFDAETFEINKDMRIGFSKRYGFYIYGTGWTPRCTYLGLDLSGKKTLKVWAASTAGKAKFSLDFDGKGRADIEVKPSNRKDDFIEYSVEIPDTSAKKLTVFGSESVTILKFKAE